MTTTPTHLVSKVLVLEPNPAAMERIREFCQSHRLQGLRVGQHNIHSVLQSNVDLGGVLIPQRIGTDSCAGLKLVRHINAVRPELPIFLRLEDMESEAELSAEDLRATCVRYTLSSIDRLDEAVGDNIFGVAYPATLVQAVSDLTLHSLRHQFPATAVTQDAAYVVRDDLIVGELFSLIPLESDWFRGYLSVQADQGSMTQMIAAGKTLLPVQRAEDIRAGQLVLSEFTNLIWGAIKNRYTPHGGVPSGLVQVPIIVNHLHRCISFGSSQPHLCFRFVLTDPQDAFFPPVALHLRLVFNLRYSPESYRENDAALDTMLSAGELELF